MDVTRPLSDKDDDSLTARLNATDLNCGDMDISDESAIESQANDDIREVVADGQNKAGFRRFTREELLKYKDAPMSLLRPKSDNSNMCCWKRPEDDLKRRTNDPRERTKRENDGIVLSPQRGANFKQGCSVNQTSQQPAFQQRRIGSGRLANREWEADEERDEMDDGFVMGRRKKYNSISSDDGRGRVDRQGRPNNGIYRNDGDGNRGMRGGRPSNGHGIFQLNQSPPYHRQRHSGAGDRRNSFGSDTPEWFTEGPTSRHDRIDLHGFDGPESPNDNGGFIFGTESPPVVSSTTTNNSGPSPAGQRRRSSPKSPKETVMPPNPEPAEETKIAEEPHELEQAAKPPRRSPPNQTKRSYSDFNFDDYLHFQVLGPLLADIDAEAPIEQEGKVSQSRFTQFFNSQDGHNPHQQHHNNGEHCATIKMAHDLEAINGLDEIKNMHGISAQDPTAFISALGKDQPAFGSKLKHLAETLKIPSVDELEAQVLPSQPTTANARNFQPKIAEETRFIPLNMVDERRHMLPAQMAQAQAQVHLQQQALRHQQHQQQMLYAPPSVVVLPPVPPAIFYMIVAATPTPEIVAGADYISILSGVKQGVIHPQQLVNLLLKKNSIKSSRQRDVVLTVLNVIWSSQRAGSPIIGRDGNNIPLKHQSHALPTRGDLAAHTASIMQNALIKRKLEEQLENYRRRQDGNDLAGQRSGSPTTAQPSMLAFTPTAVLRKMTGTNSGGAPSANAGYLPDAGHIMQFPPMSVSPQPQPIQSPLRSSTPVHQNDGLGAPVLASAFGPLQGHMSPTPVHGTLPHASHYGGAPLHMLPPTFCQPVRYTPQAFIGQFAQPHMASRMPTPDKPWWIPESMPRPVLQPCPQPMPNPMHNFPVQAPMMTVEELERAQQRANEVINEKVRRRGRLV